MTPDRHKRKKSDDIYAQSTPISSQLLDVLLDHEFIFLTETYVPVVKDFDHLKNCEYFTPLHFAMLDNKNPFQDPLKVYEDCMTLQKVNLLHCSKCREYFFKKTGNIHNCWDVDSAMDINIDTLNE